MRIETVGFSNRQLIVVPTFGIDHSDKKEFGVGLFWLYWGVIIWRTRHVPPTPEMAAKVREDVARAAEKGNSGI